MKENNKITEEELNILNNLHLVLAKYNISKDTYLISEEYQTSEQVKFCLVKTKIGKWNTCFELHAGIYDSIYHPSLTTAIIKFLEYVAPSDEEYLLMLQEFLNLNTANHTKNNPIKYLRKKH